ncbi:hypothetical protein [Caballeronia zhejiangensis]|uniref:Uncharacterized protein n=1 Tax=Caballeronia zhejiangensis TaxID=871203 RepID=A0A656QIL5_9BURK|nr:hypothetical protein [Caballeronia zhejiangensis]KDR29952.1 hypothetical protein BG60_05440 [Caballeronia zhejiangensis]
MSIIALSELLKWRDQLPEESGEEAHMLNALIARREAEMRARIADSIAAVSQRENWKLQRCAAIARRVEETPVRYLVSIDEFFQNRNEGAPHVETPEVLSDFFADDRREAALTHAPLHRPATQIGMPGLPTPVVNLHGVMGSLESRVAETPGIACGLQGIRIMRMVALMSKARSAQIARMRMNGTQAFYRHS